MTKTKIKDFKFWIAESRKQAQIALSRGIAPNTWPPYILAQKMCHELFNKPQ